MVVAALVVVVIVVAVVVVVVVVVVAEEEEEMVAAGENGRVPIGEGLGPKRLSAVGRSNSDDSRGFYRAGKNKSAEGVTGSDS